MTDNLVTQPSRKPTRKIWAVIIGGVVAGAVQGGISTACDVGVAIACTVPDMSDTVTVLVASGVTLLVSAVSGYLTRERER